MSTISQTLYNLGREAYGGSFEESRNYLLGSLYAQLTELDIISPTVEPELTTPYSAIVDPLLLTISQGEVIQKVNAVALPLLAKTLRWTGQCYQNIDRYSALGVENDKRFQFLYGTAEELLLKDDSEEGKNELAELYYNTEFFMYLRKFPEDYLGACEVYEKALAIDSSAAMRARVGNMRMILKGKAGEILTADQFNETVLAPYMEMPESDQDPFLIALYHNNYAKMLMKEKRLEEADKVISVTVDHMEQQEKSESPKLHPYFTFFYQTLANLRTFQGKTEEGISASRKAEEHAKRNPGSYTK